MSMMVENTAHRPAPAAAVAGNPKPRRLAHGVEAKLRSAEQWLADLQAQVDDLALSKALDEPGATERLTELEGKIRAARDNVNQLGGAHRLAIRKDAESAAKARSKIRNSQFAALQSHARSRSAAMAELSEGIEQASKAYRRFLGFTERMAAALPVGTTLPPTSMGSLGEFGSALGYAEKLIAAEMWKFSGIGQIGDRGALPGASPPNVSLQFNPGQIRPAVEVIEEANSHLLDSIKRQIAVCDEAELAVIKEKLA
jgi:hypothetical protein